ncbi:MAG TPA: antitoxin Xre/MbcA/ParS toxin-binding domain-containing protein [Chitinophagaceae bacterium]|nr:antitoxin Xre/MbcA/ParS toxin-binding domain-containing protein [Chitinophagaceae bacterium]
MEKHKNIKKKAEYKPYSRVSKIHEPVINFAPVKQMPLVKDFNYKEFKKIADKVPFTLQEWSQIIHISERTLQRYAKANSNVPFSVVDRILQIDKVIKRGIEVFGNLDKFISWLRSDPYMLEGRLSLQSLRSIEGINLVLTQLGRIEHGILA